MTKFKLILLIISLSILGSCKTNKSVSTNKNWLDGKWTGTGYQIDLQEDNQWSILLNVNTEKELYNISYPSLSCSGKWQLIKHSKDQATFKEVINKNTLACTTDGLIILSRIDNNRVLYSYFYKDDNKASAFSTLEKNKMNLTKS